MFGIDGYEIKQQLGQGGMATVYLAHEQKLDRKVALKVMIPSPTQDPSICTRFLKEARTVANLHHSNIVSIYDVGEQGGVYFMAMEYLPGGNLRDRIQGGVMAPDLALAVTRQLASALGHAHDEGYIHRDIKPENVLFRKDGTPVLTDFGIAKAVGSSTKMTKTGMSIGTPHYMSPEQARGKELDGRSDLYSLGIVLYEMLTGRVPFEAEDSIAIAVKHIQEPIPELPGQLSQYQPLLDKLLAKDPVDRFQSGAELVNALNNPEGRADMQSAPTPNRGSSTHSPSSAPRHPSPATAKPARVTRHPSPGPQTRLVDNQDDDSDVGAGLASARKRNLTIGLGIALVVLVVILIAVLNQGKTKPEVVNNQPVTTAQSPVPATPNEDPQARQNAAYDGHIASARSALARNDLDSAAREIDLAKAIRSGNEVALLEESLRTALSRKKLAEAQAEEKRLAAAQSRQEEQARKAEEKRLADQERTRQEEARAAEAERARQEAERRAREPQPFTDRFGIEMVRIPGGSFQMGSDSSESESDEKPVHRVTVSTFYMSKTEVTQGQWKAVMGNNPSGSKTGDNYPVENVSWNDAQEFIRKLNQQTGKRYRLPTEAEWEYAARGGTSSDRYGNLNEIAWYTDNTGSNPEAVGRKQANSYGLYDMLGNVWEWCSDWYGSYSSSSQDNPTGPSSGSNRVLRGGSWNFWARGCRAPIRGRNTPDCRGTGLGFRLAAVSD